MKTESSVKFDLELAYLTFKVTDDKLKSFTTTCSLFEIIDWSQISTNSKYKNKILER